MGLRGEVLLWLVAAGILAACGETVGPLDLDVVVSSVDGVEGGYVTVYPRWRDRYCENSLLAWPADGDCVSLTDIGYWSCDEPPTTCIDRVRVTRLDYTVGEAAFEPGLGSALVGLPAFGPEAGYSLEVEGCGGRARVELPSERMDGLDIEDVIWDGAAVVVHWTVDGTDGQILVSRSSGMGAIHCLVEDTGERRAAPSYSEDAVDLSLAAVTGEQELATAVGIVRLWRTAARFLDVWVPRCSQTSSSWLLPRVGLRGGSLDLALLLDGNPVDTSDLRLEWATYQERSSGVELRLAIRIFDAVSGRPDVQLHVTVGPEGERWQLMDSAAVLSTATRSDTGALSGLVPGSPAPASIRFHPAPVDLQALEDPADALHLELSLEWDVALVIPRPPDDCIGG